MMAQLEGLNLLVKLTTSSALISALLFPSVTIAQPRIPVPVPPPGRSTQAPPTPPPVPDKEQEEPEEVDEPTDEPAEPSEPEEGGGTEQIAPKLRIL